MAPWSSLYRYVLPDTPGCPELVVDQNLRQAAIDFLRDSGAYVVNVPAFAYTADVSAYTHAPAADTQLSGVIEARVAGQTHSMQLGTPSIAYNARTALYPSVFIAGDDNINFTLWPTPTVSGTLAYRYSAYPTQTAATVPDIVVAQWADAIARGAKARILALPGKSYTNAKLASLYEQQFRATINRAKILRQRGALTAGTRVRFWPFGV